MIQWFLIGNELDITIFYAEYLCADTLFRLTRIIVIELNDINILNYIFILYI